MRRRGRVASGSRAREGRDRGGEEGEAVGAVTHRESGVRPEALLGRVLRVRHQANDVAALVSDAGDVVSRAVGVDVEVTEHHATVTLEPIDRVLVSDEAAL